MKREYRTIKPTATGFWMGGKIGEAKLDQMMNGLGELGWERVAALDTNEVYGGTRDAVAIFKRQKGRALQACGMCAPDDSGGHAPASPGHERRPPQRRGPGRGVCLAPIAAHIVR